jgi:hypothetical protein
MVMFTSALSEFGDIVYSGAVQKIANLQKFVLLIICSFGARREAEE